MLFFLLRSPFPLPTRLCLSLLFDGATHPASLSGEGVRRRRARMDGVQREGEEGMERKGIFEHIKIYVHMAI